MTTLTYGECDELFYILFHTKSLKSYTCFTLLRPLATALDSAGMDEEGVSAVSGNPVQVGFNLSPLT